MATLLPNGKQTFISANGDPLASGSVFFYVPSTTTFKDTWQDSGATILNTNPVILDASGEAIIYGSGVYRQVVYDSAGNLIWDQITADTAVGGIANGGVSTGTENAQVVAASSFSSQDGQAVEFIAGFTNTGALTVDPGGGAIPVLLDGASGPVPLSGGEVTADNSILLLYEAARGAFHLVNPTAGAIFGGIISNTTIILQQSAAPVPTTEGEIWWDTNDDQIKIGDGSGTKTFSDDSKVAILAAQDQVITGGARVTPLNLGNLSGASITPDPGDRPIQTVTNNGAGSILPGSNEGQYTLQVLNTTGAGVVTLTGWTTRGDIFDTTTTSRFVCSCLVTSSLKIMTILKVA